MERKKKKSHPIHLNSLRLLRFRLNVMAPVEQRRPLDQLVVALRQSRGRPPQTRLSLPGRTDGCLQGRRAAED